MESEYKDPRQMVSDLSTCPEERLSDWDKALIATCAAALENGEELDARRLEKLSVLHSDRLRVKSDEEGDTANG